MERTPRRFWTFAVSAGAVLVILAAAASGVFRLAVQAVPGYRAKVEADLQELSTPPPEPGEKVFEWHPPHLLGRRFRKESEVDQALEEISKELEKIKERVRAGFTVVVK